MAEAGGTARMRFGLAMDFGTTRAPLDRVLDEYVPLLRLAEDYGFESVWAGENYPTVRGAFHLPSPLLVLAALAPRVGLRLGTGVTLAPMWHPLKLAYDATVLDQLSGGRLDLGVGLGNPEAWRRFGVERQTVGKRMDDMLQALKALWSGQQGYEGRTFSVEGGIGPLPLQPGGPPIWVGGTAPRAAYRAARWGDGWYAATPYPLPAIEQQAQRYHAALAEAGASAKPPVVAANRLAFVAETPEKAREQGGRYVEALLQTYAGMFDPDRNPRADAGVTHLRQHEGGTLLDAVGEDVCLVGSPETVSAQVERYAAAGVTHLLLRVVPADMPLPLVRQTIALVGEQVLPHFR